ncbi:MAG: RNase adapter RapZ [Eubacteriales bacterium]
MRFLLVTGLSGAGRSMSLKRLEDNGFFCVDNLPPALIYDFAHLCHTKETPIEKVAVVVDTRVGTMFDEIYSAIDRLKEIPGIDFEILYLDANDETIIKRFKQTRRMHPLSHGSVINGISMERSKLKRIKDMAGSIIDTSSLSPKQLGAIIDRLYSPETQNKFVITVVTFGYKHGIPMDADLVFDMRFIPNPFYQDNLRDKTGLDKDVRDYVLSFPRTSFFIKSIADLVNKLAPYYMEQDKRSLVIAIGCTGGQHRSVVVAEELYKLFKAQNHLVNIEHRNVKMK